MRKIIKSRESKRAESPKSIAQGNALCNELHPSPSSPERAKSFVNNRLRPVGALRFYVFILRSALRYAIDSGLSALCRLHKITPSGVERWNNLPILTCHPYGILLTATIFSTDISSLRDFLSATTEINAGIACSDRANEVEPRPNEGYPYRHCEERSDVAIRTQRRIDCQGLLRCDRNDGKGLLRGACPEQSVGARNDGVMGCLFGFSHSLFRASAHFQFSIFNFQLDKAEEAENPQPKSRH